MGVRILCTGDVHLGRRPTRIPQHLDARSLGPRHVWQAFVEKACGLRVDAVALTGDVVDKSNRFYEAFSALQSGVEQLLKNGIPVFAVSGNHDFDVLPRLADQIGEFHLLGRDGRWEEAILERDGEKAARFVGWSFPERHVRSNPLADYKPPSDDLPVIGLLHCECDAADSVYAPVPASELKAKAPSAWLLGHVHRPGPVAEGFPLILYPGSPQGLDPTETGAHGAWVVTVEKGAPPTAELLPLASLRWEADAIDVTGAESGEDLEGRILGKLRAIHDRISSSNQRPDMVGCRLRLHGRTRLHRRMTEAFARVCQELRPVLDGIEYFVEKIEDGTQPDVRVEEIARSNDPAGLLARRLLLLERREPEAAYRRLIRGASEAIEQQRSRSAFAFVPGAGEAPSEDTARSMLIKTGLSLLDHLLAQKGGDG